MSKQVKKKQIEIVVLGKKYPYFETMGAVLGFKRETGLDLPVDLEDNLKYMYHVVKSACRREQKPFELSFEEFCDGLDPEEFNRVILALQENANRETGEEGDEKNA